MTFPLVAAAVFTLATFVLAAPWALVRRWRRRPQGPFWRGMLWLHLGLFLLHLFVTFPAALGLLGSRGLGTRPHERSYAGPRLSADGRLLQQSWDSLRREADAGRPEVDAAIVAAARAREHRVASSDGVTLRVFRLEAKVAPPVAVAVLVHGLFRSAMELEPVAGMLRELGCECWLVELRNHGGSTRAPFTGGLRESDDVVAAVGHVRSQPGCERAPVLLFGVSLGTIAVSLALPRLDGLAGVVLDAPMEDLHAAAHRMLAFERAGDGRSFFRIDEPWRSTVLVALGAWSGFRVQDVSPFRVLGTLPHDLPMLVVGAGKDDRAPPELVAGLFERLPMPPALKELWIRPESGHGHVFLDAPAEYAERLQRLVARLRR
jgi:pimeloyl-ACP methyl ester carboxylesterase